MWKRAIEAAITPPGLCLVLLLAALLLRKRRPRASLWFAIAAGLLLWLAATPAVAGAFLRTLQSVPPLPADGALPDAQAIVVLSAEGDRGGVEYGGPTVGPVTLVRVRYAATLHRRSKLPVLTSGGRPGSGLEPLADSMAQTLEMEFATPVRWRERQSADTWENAKFSAELLQKDGVRRVLLVTHGWHLPRAIEAFAAHGIEAVGAGTGWRSEAVVDWTSWLPASAALRDTTFALHEWIGRLAYSVRR
jgi:uncharacterized SAM-binding protein YcdF (DUF218 family)